MKLSHLFKLICLAPALLSGQAANANDYPTSSIRLIVPFAPGSASDFVARHIGKALGDELGQAIVIENKGGASGVIAARDAVSARPDGYTLFLGTVTTHMTNPLLFKSLPYDPVTQFVPIGLMTDTPRVLAVSMDLPVKTFDELIRYGQANPGKLNYGSAAALHVGLETLRSAYKLDMVRIQYKGGSQATNAAAAGQLDVVMDGTGSILTFVKAGKLRALATTSEQPLNALPDVPTPAQLNAPDMRIVDWSGLYAPAGTPPAVIEKLRTSLQKTLTLPELRQTFATYDIKLFTGTMEEYESFVPAYSERMAKLVKAAGFEPQ